MRTSLLTIFRGKTFYWAYFYIICLYIVFLRVRFFPSTFAYLLYGISIAVAVFILYRSKLKAVGNKTDIVLILFFMIYYIISSICFVGFGGAPELTWLIKDWLYSLLPILFYILVRLSKYKIDEQLLLKTTLYSILILDIIAIAIYAFPGSTIASTIDRESFEEEGYIYALTGVCGVIVTGFLNVLGLSICLLSPIKINRLLKVFCSILFVVCVFLAGQRTPIGGIVIVVFAYLIRLKGRGVLGLVVLLSLMVYAYNKIDYQVDNISVKEVMTERYLGRFDQLKSGDSNRNDQYEKTEDKNIFEYVFGSGVGKYSPENPYTKNAMPDAMLNRIFNEMGFVGLFTFLSFFFVNILVAIKKKNEFMIAFILYIFVANTFNRVLFIAPTSILPYVFIAFFNWCRRYSPISLNSSKNER